MLITIVLCHSSQLVMSLAPNCILRVLHLPLCRSALLLRVWDGWLWLQSQLVKLVLVDTKAESNKFINLLLLSKRCIFTDKD